MTMSYQPDAYEYEHNPTCSHCRANIVDREGYEATLCADCRSLADLIGEIVTCETCETELMGLVRCNSTDVIDAYSDYWYGAAAKGVDPIATFPNVRAGQCIECCLERLNAVVTP